MHNRKEFSCPQASILLQRFHCTLMGYETPFRSATLSAFGLQAYSDSAGNIRIFKPGQVGMIIAKEGTFYRIQHIYTLPVLRRKGLAKMLLASVRLALGNVRHCQWMSEAGKAWAEAVA